MSKHMYALWGIWVVLAITANAEDDVLQRLSRLESRVSRLEAEKRQLTAETVRMSVAVRGLRADNSALRRQHQRDRWQLARLSATTRARVLEAEARLAELSADLQRCRTHLDSAVFFTAVTNTEEDYGAGDEVKFHEATTNVSPGGDPGWDPTINRFVCPVSGYYMFLVTLHRHQLSSIDYNHVARLIRTSGSSNVYLTELHTHRALTLDGNVYMSGTMHAIARCDAGDTVWVQMQSAATLYGDFHRNQFTGLLLMEDSEAATAATE